MAPQMMLATLVVILAAPLAACPGSQIDGPTDSTGTTAANDSSTGQGGSMVDDATTSASTSEATTSASSSSSSSVDSTGTPGDPCDGPEVLLYEQAPDLGAAMPDGAPSGTNDASFARVADDFQIPARDQC